MESPRSEFKFPPNLWGDQFIDHFPDPKYLEKYLESMEEVISEVERLLTSPESTMREIMNIIDYLERLGFSYRFENEIEEKLQELFLLNIDYDHDDLFTVALHFRLFRQHGHRISTDVFLKWMDENGKFRESIKSDVKGMLRLYEASHVGTDGETILNEALAFTTDALESMVRNLESPLKEHVERALVQPLHLGIQRLEARSYIGIYEELNGTDDDLANVAKIEYNLLQILHRKELQQVSRWWNELGLISKLPYARDRIEECFFCAVGVYHEPQYSRARVILAKSVAIASLIEDTYKAYGKIRELEVFTEAIRRWDSEEICGLPEYMRPLYEAILEFYTQLEEELAKERRSYAPNYAIKGLKELVKYYLEEAKYYIRGKLPPFFERVRFGMITSTFGYLVPSSFLGIESARKEDFEWISDKPKILDATLINGCLLNDIGSYEFEMESGHIAMGIESYMKDMDVTKNRAVREFTKLSSREWEICNEEMLRPSFYKSRDLLTRIFNFNRVAYVTFKDKENGYTQPLKTHILAMLVDAFEISQSFATN